MLICKRTTSIETYGHMYSVQEAAIIHCTQVYNINDQVDFFKTDLEIQHVLVAGIDLFKKKLFQSVSSSDITAIVDKHNALRSNPMARRNAQAMCRLVSGITFSKSKVLKKNLHKLIRSKKKQKTNSALISKSRVADTMVSCPSSVRVIAYFNLNADTCGKVWLAGEAPEMDLSE